MTATIDEVRQQLEDLAAWRSFGTIPPPTGRMRAAPEGVGSTSRGLTVTLSGRRTAVDQPTRTHACSIDGCERLAATRGWCGMHYRRFQRTGDPLGLKGRATRTCSVNGCEGKHKGHGLCNRHYQRLMKYGRLDTLDRTPLDRFMSFVSKTTSCWEWTGAKTLGYPIFSEMGENVRAHRWSYEHFVGPIPEGMVIDHMCHNPGCVNPEHLRVATNKENGQNRKGPVEGSKLGVIGVAHDGRRGTYWAHITEDGKQSYLGTFSNIADATAAARAARLERFSVPEDPREREAS